MVDGGRNAARGLRYQYLRTLDALLDAVEESQSGVVAVHVEGLPGPDGADADSIDYELSDASGRIVSAVQVKARAPGAVMGAGQVFKALAGLVRDRNASRYQLSTSAAAGDSAMELVAVLGAGLALEELRTALDAILASVSAGQPRNTLDGLGDEYLTRLCRASVDFDPRDDAEISESLRLRLRHFRNQSRAGLGDESAGLVVGYLISEVFRRAGNAAEATIPIAHFRSLLLVDGATLAGALGRRDWGVIVGPLPSVPDVRRADVLGRIQSALPLRTDIGPVTTCTLTGLSGIGKTSLAVGYILDRANVYDTIFWADAESEQTLTSSFSRIFRYFHGEDKPEPSKPAHLRDAVLSDLSCTVGLWLLILDNCTDTRLLDNWVPQAGTGHVIVTTTNSARPPRAGTQLEVTSMASSQAVELLRLRLAPQAQLDGPRLGRLVRLARELECWPLALELACAYLHGSGLGVHGIPEYLHRLKLRSLSDPDSVPPGYPRPLIQAIGLCLQRIREKADGPESRTAWAAMTALGVMRIAAYMSSRQIPVYLVMSVPEIELGDEAFRGSNLFIADCPDHPPAEVVRILRAYSLVTVDERLPPDGRDGADDRRYDYTITVNTILQEVMQDRFDGDRFTGLIVDRLAWHTERWMKAAFEIGAHERALILATHASALEEHAARLNLRTDFVAFLRGNLASVHYRQRKNDQVVHLLRSEIDHYRGRREEHARMLTCQASIQLAAVLADDTPGSVDEIADLLETAYLIVVDFVPLNPEGMAFLVANIYSILSQIELRSVRHERLSMLIVAVRDLAGRLPDTPYSMAIRTLDEIRTCMHEHNDCGRAADLARKLLASSFAAENTQEAIQLRVMARESLIEALAAQQDMEGALAELNRFAADAKPPSMFIREIEDLVHNTGYLSAFLSLAGAPGADELLSLLLSDGRKEVIQSSFKDKTAARIDLLSGVSAFQRGDINLARKCADKFLEKAPSGEMLSTEEGWRRLAHILADATAIQQDKEKGFGRSTNRLHDDSGFARLLMFTRRVQDMLVCCSAELLPLLAALAIVHSKLTSAPGTRRVPLCWQLQGGLEYLGFESEVIAASAVVKQDGDSQAEYIGEYRHCPSLREDGSSDGHTVVWSASFGQMIDPTIMLARHLDAAVKVNPDLSFPMVLPVANRNILFAPAAIGTMSRAPISIAWKLHPEWTRALTPTPGSDLDSGVSHGKLALAHTTLDVIRGLNGTRSDSPQLRSLYPPLAALLDGRSELPGLPSEPPAAFLRLSPPDGHRADRP